MTIDGLIHTGALSSAIPEANFNENRLSTHAFIIEESQPSDFHIIVSNGGFEHTAGIVILQFEVSGKWLTPKTSIVLSIFNGQFLQPNLKRKER